MVLKVGYCRVFYTCLKYTCEIHVYFSHNYMQYLDFLWDVQNLCKTEWFILIYLNYDYVYMGLIVKNTYFGQNVTLTWHIQEHS